MDICNGVKHVQGAAIRKMNKTKFCGMKELLNNRVNTAQAQNTQDTEIIKFAIRLFSISFHSGKHVQ